MSSTEDSIMMEVSAVVSKPEVSLVSSFCYESHGEFRSAHEYLGWLIHDDECMSRFKTSTYYSNFLRKECLDDVSIRTALTKALIDVSDTGNNLEVKNYVINVSFE